MMQSKSHWTRTGRFKLRNSTSQSPSGRWRRPRPNVCRHSAPISGNGRPDLAVFLFKEGVFGTYNSQPYPTQDTKINLSNGVTGYAIASVAQPLTQLYQLHLAIREQELSTIWRPKISGETTIPGGRREAGVLCGAANRKFAGCAAGLVKQYQETDRVATQYLEQKSILKSDSLDVKLQLAQAQNQMITSRTTSKSRKNI